MSEIDSPYKKELLAIGYTIFEPLDDKIVTELDEFYHSIKSPTLSGFHPSMFWKDEATKKQISIKICTVLQQWVEENFPDFDLLYGNFMVKEPGEDSIMKMHQDWSYVDESQHKSFAIWFPLMDLNQQNGALSMIPKSHLFTNNDRGPGVHCPFYENEKYLIDQFGVSLYLQKGQPVVWEHHLLHYSPPNRSTKSRIGVTAIIVPKGIPVYHYYKNDDDKMIEQFKIEPDFYFNYTIGTRPERFADLIQQKEMFTPTYTIDNLTQILSNKSNNGQNGWLKKLKKIFS